jgi:integrase
MLLMNEQAQTFMDQIQTRRRDPAKAKTIAAYRSYLDNWVLPLLGEKPIKEVENGTLKTFVSEIHLHLAPTTVTAVAGLVKAIVASAVDKNGNQLYPRTWNNEFMDLPIIRNSDLNASVIAQEAVQEALGRAQRLDLGVDASLWALLAGSGLRIGEALSLNASDWDRENAIVKVKSTLLPDGTVQNSPKTEAGIRQVDLNQELNQFLSDNLSSTDGRLFPGSLAAAYKRLAKVGVNVGFHSFRRFRATHLDKTNVPEGLKRFWLGHAASDISQRYVKIGSDIQARKEWCEKIGLGFKIP